MKNNFDLNEKIKFEALANEWWDPSGKCRPLHDINPVRLQFITDRFSIENKTVLDIGCGAGILSESMAKKGAIVTGIDIADALIKAAQEHAITNNIQITYETMTAESFADLKPHSFDAITCMELLEHVPDPECLIKACAKLIKPQGQLFFSTINRNLKSYFLAIIAAEKILKILPNHTHQYEKLIRPQEFASALCKADLKLIELAGMQYNPFTHKASLSRDVSVNYLAHVGA